MGEAKIRQKADPNFGKIPKHFVSGTAYSKKFEPTRSITLPEKQYKSFGECIFCSTTKDLTREHVVPEALSGAGQMFIIKGSCKSCNKYANEKYENTALQNDFLPVRVMLGLRRKKQKTSTPKKMPKVSYTGIGLGAEGFDVQLEPDEYPDIARFVMHAPAGRLTGEDKSDGSTALQPILMRLGRPAKHRFSRVATRESSVLGAPEMLVAKMAYCYAIAEKGLHFADLTDLRDLLTGKRNDVFNFVGKPLNNERFFSSDLHAFNFYDRELYITLVVTLFASFGGVNYEVVLAPK
jgi:hypothetical protein